MLNREIGTAQNIKEKKTRRKVTKTLRKLISKLSKFPKTENGLYAFASPKDVWIVVPEYRNNLNDYRCGKGFMKEWLRDPVSTSFKLCVSVKDASLSKVYSNGAVTPLRSMKSGISSDHNQGGASQNRLHRKREEAIGSWLKKVKREALSISDTWEVSGEKSTVKRYNKIDG